MLWHYRVATACRHTPYVAAVYDRRQFSLNSDRSRIRVMLPGRVSNKLDQANSVIFIYSYDADNRLTNRWTPAKGNTGYTYDSAGNLTFIHYPVSTSVTFQYDALNRLTNMVDAAGTTRYTYTAAGQLLTETGPFASDTVTNIYWNRQRAWMNLQLPFSVWTNGFAYDQAGRLASVVSPAGTFYYQYLASLPSTLVAQLNLPNGSYITNTYDGNARLLGTVLNTSGGTPLDAAIYGYNAGNERLAFTNAAGTNVLYTYDKIGQLKVAKSTASGESRGYVYDAAWNVSYVTNIGPFSVDVDNQLTGAPTDPCGYDANGNLIYYGKGANSGLLAPSGPGDGEYCYCYDDENRLTTWRYAANAGSPACGSLPTSGSDLESQFIYDGLGRLRERIDYMAGCGAGDWCWQATNEVLYVYDGMRVIQERNGGNFPTANFTRGSDLSGTMEGAGGIGGLLARSSGFDTNGNPIFHFYYHADGNGNIMCLESSVVQTIAESCRYDAFGNPVSGSFHEFGFSSKEWFGNGGLYYYGYRWYSPSLQRWLNRDPIGEQGGVNLYAFELNNMPNVLDYFGLAPGASLPNPVLPPNFPNPMTGPLSIPKSMPPGTPLIPPGTPPADPPGAPAGSAEDAPAGAAANALEKAGWFLNAGAANRAWNQAVSACNKTPHSFGGTCSCCVITLTAIQNGPDDYYATGGYGYVVNTPCSQAKQNDKNHGTLSPSDSMPSQYLAW